MGKKPKPPEDQTLRLDAGFQQESKEETSRYAAARDESLKELIAKQIIPRGEDVRPADGPPSIEGSLGDMSATAATKLLGTFASWLSYLVEQSAFFEMEHEALERRARNVKAQLRLRARGTAADKSDAAITDQRFIDIDTLELQAKYKARLTAAAIDGFERKFFSVSRAITSQGHEIDRTVLVGNSGRQRRRGGRDARNYGSAPETG